MKLELVPSYLFEVLNLRLLTSPNRKRHPRRREPSRDSSSLSPLPFSPTPTMPAFPKLVAFDLDYTVCLRPTMSLLRNNLPDLPRSSAAVGPLFVLSPSSVDFSFFSSLTSSPLLQRFSLQGSTPTSLPLSNGTVKSSTRSSRGSFFAVGRRT